MNLLLVMEDPCSDAQVLRTKSTYEALLAPLSRLVKEAKLSLTHQGRAFQMALRFTDGRRLGFGQVARPGFWRVSVLCSHCEEEDGVEAMFPVCSACGEANSVDKDPEKYFHFEDAAIEADLLKLRLSLELLLEVDALHAVLDAEALVAIFRTMGQESYAAFVEELKPGVFSGV